jgi:hypothetical protein
MTAPQPTYRIEEQGVMVSLPPTKKAPSEMRQLSFKEVAALTDYDALALGLPLLMQAVVVLRVDGRIDTPDFTLTYTVEPFNHMHPYAAHQREGCFLKVGTRVMRLNPQQFEVLERIDAMRAAGEDIAARLTVWEQLMQPLHAGKRSYVLVQNDLPNLRISMTPSLPARAMTRVGKLLKPVANVPAARWAMDAGRRYYVRPAG